MAASDPYRVTLTTPLKDDSMRVSKFYGEESMSGLFHFTVEVVSEKSDLDFKKIVGKHATLNFKLSDGKDRFLDGIVSRFAQGFTDYRATTYYVELRPWLWQCTLTSDSRIFQDKKTDEIIKAVFEDLGFKDHEFKLSGSYKPRTYCVQYRESAFDFISRLMEDEGMFYFFKHESGKHKMVIADAKGAHTPFPGQTKAHVTWESADWEGEDRVYECTLEQRVVTGKVTVGDFFFETPTADLKGDAKGKHGKLEVREHPAGYSKKADAKGLATKRIEELEAPQKELRGKSHFRGAATGFKVTLQDHVRKDINTDWVFKWIRHYHDLKTYRNDFRAFDAKLPFRPPRTTRKPLVQGTQTALVVGKKGEEIWTDKFGRVKVQFHWDREGKKDEKSSCWVRVSQAWAGKKWGGLFIPRIGMEVVVSFLDGDPDRPMVTGCVYNSDNMPNALPAKATQSGIKTLSTPKGKGFNQILFEDKKDKEEFFMHAQKDMKIKILNDLYRDVDKDEKTNIKNSRTITVKEKDDKLTVLKGNRAVAVTKGNETYKVGGTRDLTVSKAVTHKYEDKFTHSVKKDYTLKIDGDLKIEVKGDISVKAKGAIKFDAGKDFAVKAKMNISQDAKMAVKVKAGIKLDMKAPQIQVKAAAMAKISAGAMMDIKGGAMLKAKGGAMANVAGGGMLMLKGGLAKIN